MYFRFLLVRNEEGFLLMEALLVILVFSMTCIIMGMYVKHICYYQIKTNNYLQMISSAAEIVDKLLLNKSTVFKIASDPMDPAGQGEKYFLHQAEEVTISCTNELIGKPNVVQGSFEFLDNIDIAHIEISSDNQTICLDTIVSGQR